jgi:hypothetical protein
MSASTPLSKVEKMLKECAPGYTIRLANHSRVIHFGGKVYRTFPKADPVENGHIRKLVRFLGIDTACAAEHLPGVIRVEQVPTEAAKPQDKSETPPSIQTKATKKR